MENGSNKSFGNGFYGAITFNLITGLYMIYGCLVSTVSV